MKRLLVFSTAVILATAGATTREMPAAVKTAMNLFRAEAIAAHDKFLASDLLEGCGPGTRGDAIAEEYIATTFQSYGLKPGGDRRNKVRTIAPIISVSARPASLPSRSGRAATSSASPRTSAGNCATTTGQIAITSPAISSIRIGTGLPQFKWDNSDSGWDGTRRTRRTNRTGSRAMSFAWRAIGVSPRCVSAEVHRHVILSRGDGEESGRWSVATTQIPRALRRSE